MALANRNSGRSDFHLFLKKRKTKHAKNYSDGKKITVKKVIQWEICILYSYADVIC